MAAGGTDHQGALGSLAQQRVHYRCGILQAHLLLQSAHGLLFFYAQVQPHLVSGLIGHESLTFRDWD
jgi:hypothetical protein